LYTSVLLAGILSAGCDTITRTQVRISPAETRAGTQMPLSAADRDAMKAALQPIATQLKLQDITGQSLIPNVIAHFQQMDTTTPIKLIAWEDKGGLLVDLMQGAPTPGETGAYQRARDNLVEILRAHFGERVTLVPYRHEAEQRRRFAPEQ